MKIDASGIDEIKSTIETPFTTLAQQLSEKGKLDNQTNEIVTFIFEQIQKIGEDTWEIID